MHAFYAEDFMDALFFEVAVNKKHRLVELHCQAQCKINCSEGFSFSFPRTGYHNGAFAFVLRGLGNLGPQDFVRIDLAGAH